MKATTADAIRRLLNDPGATDGERDAARARLAEAGVPVDPPRPPAPPASPAPGWHGWTWTSTTNTSSYWTGSVWVDW